MVREILAIGIGIGVAVLAVLFGRCAIVDTFGFFLQAIAADWMDLIEDERIRINWIYASN
jgi:hypothetical protein